jgi:mono/diheme cytochrome c family protein
MMLRTKEKELLLCLVVSVGLISGYSVAEQVPDIEAGKKLYDKHCAGCHGENAVGQDPSRRGGSMDENMVPIAPALNGTAHTWHHPPKLLFRYIDKGSIMKGSPMPAFGDKLNRQEILSIISYFQSLWSEKRRQWYFEKYKNN